MSAEDAVAADYARRGLTVIARRWRSAVGEIDLICGDDAGLVFVEVKQARDFARAALRLTPAQLARIWSTAEAFLGTRTQGLLTPARVDLALVDATGRVRIIENVTPD